jgi:hypothetical protein
MQTCCPDMFTARPSPLYTQQETSKFTAVIFTIMLKMELIFAIKINVAYRIQYFREQSFYYFVQSGHDLYAHRATVCDLYLKRSRKGVVQGTLVAAKKKKRKKLRIKQNVCVNSL